MKKFFKKTEGFTLVELIVVIAILGILAGVGTVGYSGYIKKANEAADNQLLGTINHAFATACLENGVDAVSLSGVSIQLEGEAGNKTVKSVSKYDDDFKKYYAGNETSAFKTISELYFVKGLFTRMSEEMAALQKYLIDNFGDEIAKVQGSIYHEIGYGALAGQIDNATSMMAVIAENDTSGFYELLNGDGNWDTLLGYFENDEELDALVLKKIEQLKNSSDDYKNMSDSELDAIAINHLLANTAVLTAAQNTTAINNDFIAALGNGTAVSMLKTSTDGGDATSDTVAQAAFAYAMYTSYKASIGETPSGEVDLMDVYDTLETEGFQDYMNNDSAADKDGYLGAMQLIVGSANNADSSTINDILLNGFNSSELVGLMQNVTAN